MPPVVRVPCTDVLDERRRCEGEPGRRGAIGHRAVVAGQVGPLDLVWAAYELIGQGHEVQLLGAVEPCHVALLEGRAATPWLVLLGAGLGKPALAADWPAGTRLFGELGRLYDADWLAAHGWRATLAEVMADQPAARGLSGRGSKRS